MCNSHRTSLRKRARSSNALMERTSRGPLVSRRMEGRCGDVSRKHLISRTSRLTGTSGVCLFSLPPYIPILIEPLVDLVFVLVSYSLDASDDKALTQWHHDVIDWMTSEAKKRGLLSRWLYLNYARPDQKVYDSFGADNHKQMKAIKKKYDPKGVFDQLWPGGFKL
jgi:hypothetical protein